MQTSGHDTEHLTNRRAFLKSGVLVAGAATVGAAMLADAFPAFGQGAAQGSITKGDAAILRFLAAAEALESDLWHQYNELGGVRSNEVPGGSGSEPYTAALENLDDDM